MNGIVFVKLPRKKKKAAKKAFEDFKKVKEPIFINFGTSDKYVLLLVSNTDLK
jgi:hypothetical protein